MATRETSGNALLAEKRQNILSSSGCPGTALQADADCAGEEASKRAVSAPSGIEVALDSINPPLFEFQRVIVQCALKKEPTADREVAR